MKKIIILLLLGFTALANAQVGYVSGQDFATFIKACSIYNQADMLVEHTAKESLDLYGKEKIKDFYEHLNISSKRNYKYVSMTKNGKYVTQRFSYSLAGSDSKDIYVVLIEEDGMWKVVLPKDLKKFLK